MMRSLGLAITNHANVVRRVEAPELRARSPGHTHDFTERPAQNRHIRIRPIPASTLADP